jgi:CheY-like chemotaxis protein
MTVVSDVCASTILVVEQQDPQRSVAARILENAGYEVLVAGSGSEAVELAALHEREIDLLLTDVVVPGMLGPHLAQLLRQRIPDIRVVFTAGAAEPVGDPDTAWADPEAEDPSFGPGLLERIEFVLAG